MKLLFAIFSLAFATIALAYLERAPDFSKFKVSYFHAPVSVAYDASNVKVTTEENERHATVNLVILMPNGSVYGTLEINCPQARGTIKNIYKLRSNGFMEYDGPEVGRVIDINPHMFLWSVYVRSEVCNVPNESDRNFNEREPNVN